MFLLPQTEPPTPPVAAPEDPEESWGRCLGIFDAAGTQSRWHVHLSQNLEYVCIMAFTFDLGQVASSVIGVVRRGGSAMALAGSHQCGRSQSHADLGACRRLRACWGAARFP